MVTVGGRRRGFELLLGGEDDEDGGCLEVHGVSEDWILVVDG